MPDMHRVCLECAKSMPKSEAMNFGRVWSETGTCPRCKSPYCRKCSAKMPVKLNGEEACPQCKTVHSYTPKGDVIEGPED